MKNLFEDLNNLKMRNLIFIVLEVNVLLAELLVQSRLELRHDFLDLGDSRLDVFDLLDLLLLRFLQQGLRLLEVVVDEHLPDQELDLLVVHQFNFFNCFVDVGEVVLLEFQLFLEILDLCDVVSELVDLLLVLEGDLHLCIGILQSKELFESQFSMFLNKNENLSRFLHFLTNLSGKASRIHAQSLLTGWNDDFPAAATCAMVYYRFCF